MDNEIRGFLTADDDIHMQMHYAVESVRQCWVALTQGDNEPCEGDYDALFGVYLSWTRNFVAAWNAIVTASARNRATTTHIKRRLKKRPEIMEARIKDRRLYFGISQRELARRVGITSAAMSAIERGVHLPNVAVAILIARELQVNAEYLWGDEADRASPPPTPQKMAENSIVLWK